MLSVVEILARRQGHRHVTGQAGVGEDEGLIGTQAATLGGLADSVEEEGSDCLAGDPLMTGLGQGGSEGVVHCTGIKGVGLGDWLRQDDGGGEAEGTVGVDQGRCFVG